MTRQFFVCKFYNTNGLLTAERNYRLGTLWNAPVRSVLTWGQDNPETDAATTEVRAAEVTAC